MQNLRIYKCRLTELISASNETLHSVPALDITLQLLLTNLLYSARLKNDITHSAYDKLSVSDVEETVQVVVSVLRRGDHAAALCTVQQFVKFHTLLAAAASMQQEDSSSLVS